MSFFFFLISQRWRVAGNVQSIANVLTLFNVFIILFACVCVCVSLICLLVFYRTTRAAIRPNEQNRTKHVFFPQIFIFLFCFCVVFLFVGVIVSFGFYIGLCLFHRVRLHPVECEIYTTTMMMMLTIGETNVSTLSTMCVGLAIEMSTNLLL